MDTDNRWFRGWTKRKSQNGVTILRRFGIAGYDIITGTVTVHETVESNVTLYFNTFMIIAFPSESPRHSDLLHYGVGSPLRWRLALIGEWRNSSNKIATVDAPARSFRVPWPLLKFDTDQVGFSLFLSLSTNLRLMAT